tara:strand:- start:121 stop:513 length:393 start_codon:yes stop_codon:yes gene_type:complete
MSTGALIGIPHVPGSLDLAGGGLDCLGLTLAWYRASGLDTAAHELESATVKGEPLAEWPVIEGLANARVGDLILSTVRLGGRQVGIHVDVVVGRRPLMILSSLQGIGSTLRSAYDVTHITGIFRPTMDAA